MRMDQIAPLWESVPPRHYGGIERIVSLLLALELVQVGHVETITNSLELQHEVLELARRIGPQTNGFKTQWT